MKRKIYGYMPGSSDQATNVRSYVKAWKQLAGPLLKVVPGLTLYGFDPGFSFFFYKGQVVSLDVNFVKVTGWRSKLDVPNYGLGVERWT